MVSLVGLVSAPLAVALQRCLEALQAPLGPADLALTLARLGLDAAWALPWGLRNACLRRRWRPSRRSRRR